MKALKIFVITLAIIVVIATAFFFYARYRLNNVKDNANLEASLDKKVQKLRAKKGDYGMAIGVYKAGRTFTRGYGCQLKGTSTPPDQNSIFELASSSKLFTTSLLQIFSDRGTVHLDDKIANLLDDKILLPSSATNTTLRHLATHTSGFPTLPQSLIDKMTDDSNPYKDLKTQDLYDYLTNCVGKKPEGKYEYSNFGMGLLGHILALKGGDDYENVVQRELLKPLKMIHTFVTIDSNNAKNIIQGYDETGNPTPVWTDKVLTGAGSFLSSVSDMLLFIRANVDKTHPLYKTLSKTHAQQYEGGTGLGWMLPDGFDNFFGNKTTLWHNGMAGGYASYIAIDPVNETGIVILSNQSIDISTDGSMLMRLVNTQSWKK